jgi:HK97 gp10 family phage protein
MIVNGESLKQCIDSGAIEVYRGKPEERLKTNPLPALLRDLKNRGAWIEVVSGAEYSIYNEFGTVKMAARPYMRPALDESKAQIEKLIGQPVIIALHEVIGG